MKHGLLKNGTGRAEQIKLPSESSACQAVVRTCVFHQCPGGGGEWMW